MKVLVPGNHLMVGLLGHRDELLREVWKMVDGSTTRAVDFAVARLRQKIEPNPPEPRFLRTVHGEGYSLTVDRDSPL